MSEVRTITYNFKRKCDHANGWNKTVYFNLWIFKIKRRFFLCTDCNDLIPIDDAKKVWSGIKN